MSFSVTSLIFGLLMAALAVVFGAAAGRRADLWRSLPRERAVGMILGVVCLVWAAYYVLPMLEGGLTRFRPAVKIAVPVVAILSYFYLDFILTRAIGGVTVLLTSHLLHRAFVERVPVRPLFSVVCFAVALVGLVLIGSPWRFRDALERACRHASWRRGLGAGLGGMALFYVLFALLA